MHAAAAHRRRDDEPAAHGGEDRAGVRAADRARARRVARGRRRVEPAERRARGRRSTQRNRELQETLREQHSAAAASGRCCRTQTALANRLTIDWRARDAAGAVVHRPRAIVDVPLEDLVPYIDWTFFFAAWELKGRFPAILDHPQYGAAARELYDNAQALLDRIVDEQAADARAASTASGRPHSDGDDIVVYRRPSARPGELTRFNMLRQQEAIADGKPNRSLADFVAPRRARRRATTSARSRSPPASAPTSWSRRSSASTTTTTRSWSRRSPIGWPRRSPSTCTRRRARTGASTSARSADDVHRREVPRHPAGVRLSGLPGSQREVQAVRSARRARASASTLTETPR